VIVDSHCHASSRWYQPAESLLFEMDRHGVDKAVLIQLLGAFDNADMIAARRAHPDRFAFVAAIPSEALGTNAVWRSVEQGAAGLRLRSSARAASGEPLSHWGAAADAGLSISCVGPAASMIDGSVAMLAETFPTLTIVLEHLGGLARPDAGDISAVSGGVLALARWPNVQIKLPGLGQIAPRKPDLDGDELPLRLDGVDELLRRVIDAFGADRIMWGSDFPPVAAREGYGHALDWPHQLLAPLGETACGAIFGRTAARSFGLGLP